MFHELLPLLPRDLPPLAVGIAVGGAVLGVGLWLAGSRMSQMVMTLLAVAIGALVGRRLPGWLGINLSTWTTIIGGALVLGIIGYVYERGLAGITMGVLLAGWVAIGLWGAYAGGSSWSWPTAEADTTPWSYAISLWDQLPSGERAYLPYAGGAALLTGLGLVMVFHRVGTMLFYSVLGITLAVGLGSLALSHYKPEYLSMVTANGRTQAAGLGSLILLGVLMQWWLSPRGGSAAKPSANKE